MFKLRYVVLSSPIIVFLLILVLAVVTNFDNKSIVEYVISIVLVVGFCAFILYKILSMKNRLWGPNTLQVGEKVLFEQADTELNATEEGAAPVQTSVNYLLKVTNLRLFFLHKNGEAIHLTIVFTDKPENTFSKIFRDGIVETKKSDLSIDEYSNVYLKLSMVNGKEMKFEFKVRAKSHLDLLKAKLRI